MDLTILWVVLGAVGLVALLFLIYWGLKKLGVNLPDIFQGIDTSKFILNLINITLAQMLKDNPAMVDKIDDIVGLVQDSLEFIKEQLVIANQDGEVLDKESLMASAFEFADDLADFIGVVLEDSEREIMHTVIGLAYNAWEALDKM